MDVLRKELMANIFALGWLKFAEPGEEMRLASVRFGDVPASEYKFKIDVDARQTKLPGFRSETWSLIHLLVAQKLQEFAHREWDLSTHVPSAHDICPKVDMLNRLGMNIRSTVVGKKPKKDSLDFYLVGDEHTNYFGTPRGTIVFEDVLNTGLTTTKYVDCLERYHAIVTHVLAIFDWENGAKQKLEARGIKTTSVVKVRELFTYLLSPLSPTTEYEQSIMKNWLAKQG